MRFTTPGFVWRYGKTAWGADYTELDQWISERYMKQDAPEAPQAFQEALEAFIAGGNHENGRNQ